MSEENMPNEETLLGAPDPNKERELVKLTVSLPRSVAAFLRWKAEVEGVKRDELLRRIVVHYANKLRDKDMRTPPIVG